VEMRRVFSKIKGKVLFNEPLKRHTTFRIGGPCGVWAEPRSERDLREILKLAKARKKRTVLMGAGSNILPGDRAASGVVIHLGGKYFKRVHFSGRKVTAGAGISLAYLINLLCEKGLGGTEGLAGIPGTLGGAIFMNAGYRGNISDCLESVRVMSKKSGKISVLKKSRKENSAEGSLRDPAEFHQEKLHAGKKIKFSYRHSGLYGYIILEATLSLKKSDKKKLLKKRNKVLRVKKSEQPLGSMNAGCVFKNPGRALPAALYIDMLGFKGKRIGGAKVSEKHANFIINEKGAKASDVLRLMDIIKKRVKSEFGVELAPEIEIL